MKTRTEPYTAAPDILNQQNSKDAAAILQADEIKQVLRGHDPEKALEDDAAEAKRKEEL